MDAETLQLILTIGSLIIGGFGALATAVVAFVLGTRRGHDRRKRISLAAKATRQKTRIADKNTQIAAQRIDLEHHNTIIQGYKDLLQQKTNAHDFTRAEIHDLRNLVNELRVRHASEVSLLKKQMEDTKKQHDEEVELLKKQIENSAQEKQVLRTELAELKTRVTVVEGQGSLHPHTSESPTPATAA